MVKHWHRLLRESVESPTSVILKIQPDKALNSLLQVNLL